MFFSIFPNVEIAMLIFLSMMATNASARHSLSLTHWLLFTVAVSFIVVCAVSLGEFA
jgi:hypothetical protein